MKPSDRRSFLAGLGRAGAFMAAGPWLRALGYAQGGRGPARAWLRRSPGRVDLDRRVLGSFLEHLGRAVYTGVYEPGSVPHAIQPRVAAPDEIAATVCFLLSDDASFVTAALVVADGGATAL